MNPKVCFYVLAVAYYTHADTGWSTDVAIYFVSISITTVSVRKITM
jgi:hypothetical protein